MVRSPVEQLEQVGSQLANAAMNFTPQQRLSFYLGVQAASCAWLEQHYRQRRAGYNPNDKQAANDAEQVSLRG